MGKNKLLIFLFACATALLPVASCTYDYFVDETNYLVYVPEVIDNSIADCRVLVYNSETGELAGQRHAARPWDADIRMQQGLFGFRLPPGKYKVYCYANTENFSFTETGALDRAALTLGNEEGNYVEPSDLFFEIFTPEIVHPSLLICDTTDLERYVGRITVNFTRFPFSTSEIYDIKLVAQDVATVQPLRLDTLTSRIDDQDQMTAMGLYAGPLDDVVGIHTITESHLFMPSVENMMMRLTYTFQSSSGKVIASFPIDLMEEDNGVQRIIRLLHGQHIVIDLSNYVIINGQIEDWSTNIAGGDDIIMY